MAQAISIRVARLAAFVLLLTAASWQALALEPSTRLGYEALSKEQQATLDQLEQRTFEYFRDSANAKKGLIPDHWPDDGGEYFSSIAAVGFGLTAYGIGAERHWMTRAEAAKRTLATLRFFHDAKQGDARDATGNHGFFYHFLDMRSGARYGSKGWVELSTIDSTLLLGGVLFSQSYFDRDTADEREIRRLADAIYRRVDWRWASPRAPRIAMGWTPEAGFIAHDWQGYNEAMLLVVLALGSPTHAVDDGAWSAWAENYDRTWGTFEGQEHLGFAPLFGHQYSHVWIDFRGIQDAYMRDHGLDYFENSRRAALAQRRYAVENPKGWRDYGADVWGLTACNGPAKGAPLEGASDSGPFESRKYYGYSARGAGLGHAVDDGTIAPTAAASSIAFTPEFALEAIMGIKRRYGDLVYTRYGFLDAFNPSYTFTDRPLRTGRIVPKAGWVDTMYLGIDQGPIVAMIENYRSDLVWKVMRRNPYVRAGLKRAGFTGGWLEQAGQK